MKTKLYDSQSLRRFAECLRDDNASEATIKNYLTDVRQYLRWRRKSDYKSSDEFLEELSKKFSGSSLKRKASAIKKYLAIEKNIEERTLPTITRSLLPFAGMVFLALAVVSFVNMQSDFNGQIKDIVIAATKNYSVGETGAKPTYAFERGKGVTVELPEAPRMASPKLLADAQSFEPFSQTSAKDYSEARIAKGKKETLIVNDLINAGSFVYLSPISSTKNQVLYVKIKEEGYMVVAVENEAEEDIKFMWSIDNTKLYSDSF